MHDMISETNTDTCTQGLTWLQWTKEKVPNLVHSPIHCIFELSLNCTGMTWFFKSLKTKSNKKYSIYKIISQYSVKRWGEHLRYHFFHDPRLLLSFAPLKLQTGFMLTPPSPSPSKIHTWITSFHLPSNFGLMMTQFHLPSIFGLWTTSSNFGAAEVCKFWPGLASI